MRGVRITHLLQLRSSSHAYDNTISSPRLWISDLTAAHTETYLTLKGTNHPMQKQHEGAVILLQLSSFFLRSLSLSYFVSFLSPLSLHLLHFFSFVLCSSTFSFFLYTYSFYSFLLSFQLLLSLLSSKGMEVWLHYS